MLAERLGLGPAIAEALYQNLERWDGKGTPRGLAGTEIHIATRIAEVATQAVILPSRCSRREDAAQRQAAGSTRTWSPRTTTASWPTWTRSTCGRRPWTPSRAPGADTGRPVWTSSPARSPTSSTSSRRTCSGTPPGSPHWPTRLRSCCTSTTPSGRRCDVPRSCTTSAGSPYPPAVWERPGALRRADWEQVRLHPYQSERILARSAALEPIAVLAGSAPREARRQRLSAAGEGRRALHRGTDPGCGRLLPGTDPGPATPVRALTRGAAELILAEVAAGRLDGRLCEGCARGGRATGARPPDEPSRRSHRAGDRSTAFARARLVQRRHSPRAGGVTPYRGAPRPAHLRQDRCLHQSRCRAVRDAARPVHTVTSFSKKNSCLRNDTSYS